ncbi:MAG: MFS transporter [Desulfobacterales bacterium]|jgi:MFS family permease
MDLVSKISVSNFRKPGQSTLTRAEWKAMIFSRKKTATSRIFYGWYVLAASFFLLFFQSGARFSFGIMFKPMAAEMGWNRTSISLTFFLNTVFFALTLSLAGKLYDRYGPRMVILVSTVLLAAGYISTSQVYSLWQFHLFYGVITAVGLGGASVPLIAALMSKWFARRRGLAISLALSGNCLGQFVMVPFVNWFVLAYGWRFSYVLLGIIILAGNILLVLTVIKGDPEEMGIKPYGHDPVDAAAKPENPNNTIPQPNDLSLLQASKTRSFWFFLLFMLICGSGDFLVAAHLVPVVTDSGVSPTSAANMMAWFGLLSMGGILIAGPASDLIGNKIPIALTFVLRLILFLMILKYPSPITFFIFAIGFGFTLLITAPLTTTLVGRLYGFTHVGLISGFITTIHHLGGGFWAFMGGAIFDRTGSYQITFTLSAFLAFIAIISTLAIKEKRHTIN